MNMYSSAGRHAWTGMQMAKRVGVKDQPHGLYRVCAGTCGRRARMGPNHGCVCGVGRLQGALPRAGLRLGGTGRAMAGEQRREAT